VIGRSSEQVSFGIIKGLPPHDRRLVREWVDRTGCDWTTALLNSGAMSSRHRTTPEEDARARARAEADEAMEVWLHLNSPPDDVQHRRQGAEHEASHLATAQVFGARVPVAAISDDHSGMCQFVATGLTDLQRAAIMVAPRIWITNFRSLQFPRGATGCEQDMRDAAATGADLEQATKLAAEILRENHDAVVKLADRIDRDGHFFG
jgi:hypothetical protein